MATYKRFAQGFNITTNALIDKRLVLTKAEMKAVDSDLNPEIYFCICKENKKFYLYSKQDPIGWDPQTGNYHPLEDFIDFTTNPKAKENFEKSLNGSSSFVTISEAVNGTDPETDPGLVRRMDSIEDTVAGLTVDGGVIE